MITHLVSFATTANDRGYCDFSAGQTRLHQSASRHGIHQHIPWTRRDLLNTAFYHQNQAILDLPRGAGYFLWKPYIILDAIEAAGSDDVVMYLDADMELVADPSPLVEACVDCGGFFVAATTYQNHLWTKRDCFVFLNCDEASYHGGPHVMSGIQLYQRNERTIAFVREILAYGCRRECITDEPNTCGLPNLPGFIEHRHDQSILSLLRLKHGIEAFPDPTQWGTRAQGGAAAEVPIVHTHNRWLKDP